MGHFSEIIMRSQRNIIFTFAVVAVIFTCSTMASAQKVGGYKDIAKNDTSARAAANFAITAEAQKKSSTITLIAIEHAESQVVAGTNYRLCLKITTSGAANEADVTITVKVVVYRDLKGNYKLTSWTEEDCEGEDEA
jgi:Aspartic acid proteinase inhibitor